MWNRVRYTLWAPAYDAIVGRAGFDGARVCRLTGCGSLRVDTFDVAALSVRIFIVSAACLAAAFYPARRAAGVEAWVALRIE